MTKPVVGREELLEKLDDEQWNLPKIRDWNVTKTGIEGRIFGSTSYKDGAAISKEITSLEGNIVRISGRRHVLENPSEAAFEQALQEFVGHPLEMVEKRVRA